MVFRLDLAEAGKPVRLDNGWVRLDSRISRVGVQEYRNADGSIRRELRTPDEVFHADALSSFELSPLTNSHPQGLLDAGNTTGTQIGTVGKVRRDDDGTHVAALVQVTDGGALKDIEGGKCQLSSGYHCDLEMASGTTEGIEGVPDGLKFDAIQRNIRGNHVALVSKGRAGATVSLRLDHDDRASFENTAGDPGKQEDKPVMEKIRIDGAEVEVSTDVARAFTAKEKAAEAAEAKLTEVEARADAAEERAAESAKRADEALAPEAVATRVAERLGLEREASKILKDEKVDGLSDEEIRCKVVIAVSPAAKEKLDGASPEYIQARYDQAIETAATNGDTVGADKLREKANRADAAPESDAVKRLEAARTAWQKKKGA